jgi:MFS transporter, Spinster family, sphingosine-1-phosphate transporter
MEKRNEPSLWKSAGFGALFILTFVNLFNYLDRFILMALSPSIKRDLELSDFQVGLLATAFMYSYFLIAPLFGWLGDKRPRYWVMSAGVALWSLATVVSGLARNYGTLILSRFGVGVGEAAYGAISPSLLTDLYPKSLRGRVFAIFFMAMPVGAALGYLLGGLLEKLVGWRMAFVVAGVPGLALALALLFLREPRRGTHDEPDEERFTLKDALVTLSRNSTYVITVLGYCAYTFVLGGIAVWIPHYFEPYLGVKTADGNMVFGGITVAAGFIGTFLGGAWADRWARRSPDAYLKLSALSMFAALPIFVLVMSTSSFIWFCVWVFALEFLLFLSTSPVNAEIVNCVRPSIRATANAMGIFFIHLLGDAISPPLVGLISDHSSLYLGMWVFFPALLLGGVIWAVKPLFFWEAMPWPRDALRLPLVQCHRGYHPAGVQENSLEAFRAAAGAGAEMVELDVRLSSDGVPVVIHDADISRVSGRKGLVAALSAADLRTLANAPSLQEVLEDGACRGLLVNVELKADRAASNGLERAVAAAVVAAGAERRVIFSSFNPLALRRLAKLLPDVPRALLATAERARGNRFYLRWMVLAFLARPHMLNYDGRHLTPALARSLAARKVPFAVWTVEEPAEARKFLALGAGSIISSLPKIL